LVWSQEFANRAEAIAAERQIKGWSRRKKQALIRNDWKEIRRLSSGTRNPLPEHLA
jgi:predicted GIY-YIG superfamily endonuclease